MYWIYPIKRPVWLKSQYHTKGLLLIKGQGSLVSDYFVNFVSVIPTILFNFFPLNNLKFYYVNMKMRDNFFCWTASVFCLTVPTALTTQRLTCCYIVILLYTLYIKIVYSFIIKMQLSLAAIKLIIKKLVVVVKRSVYLQL